MLSLPRSITPGPRLRGRSAALVLVGLLGWAWAAGDALAASHPVLWDTGTRWPAEGEATDRAGWKAVPRELLQLEADPAKAKSDPGYYGREYNFAGDAVVENDRLTAVFASATGKVLLWVREARPGVASWRPGPRGAASGFWRFNRGWGMGSGRFGAWNW